MTRHDPATAPLHAVRTTQAGKTIKAWVGQGTKVIPAEQFRSYLPTPPFPDHVSGHSTFSATAAPGHQNLHRQRHPQLDLDLRPTAGTRA